MQALLKEKLVEVLKAVAPLVIMVCVVQIVLVQAPILVFLNFLAGSALAVVGMMLLFTGIDIGVLPMGRFIGAELPKKGSLALIIGVAFALGFATTIAEPDVLVLADQVDLASEGAISGLAVLYVIGVGLALFVAIAMARIVWGVPMTYLLTGAYSAVIVFSFLAPAEFVPVAYDAGSVTTGVLTAPVVIAVALGLSSVLAGRSAVADGFGLLGFASVGPIIAVMLMGMLLQ